MSMLTVFFLMILSHPSRNMLGSYVKISHNHYHVFQLLLSNNYYTNRDANNFTK